LESILGVVVVEEATAYTPDHRAVSFDKGSEGHFISMVDEAPKQLSIGQASPILQKHRPAKVLDELARLARRQIPAPGGYHRLPSIYSSPARRPFDPPFFSIGPESLRSAFVVSVSNLRRHYHGSWESTVVGIEEP
jgi:hypothetical protein